MAFLAEVGDASFFVAAGHTVFEDLGLWEGVKLGI